MKISAIICTHNRAPYLRKAIESLAEQTLPKGDCEIIVVDNRSTDDTVDIVKREFSHLQNLRYFYEHVVGLSQARNTGYRNARGTYAAYLDDDAMACPNWLEKIIDTFETVKPVPGCVGGKVEPVWEIPRPPWLHDEILGYLAIIDLSKTPFVLNERQFLAGVNMAFPKILLEESGGFPTNLGRKGKKLLSNEELLLKRQLYAKGYTYFYHPEIKVWHHIQPVRLTKKWFMHRWYWQGVSDGVMLINSEIFSLKRRLSMGWAIIKNMLKPPRQLLDVLRHTDDPYLFAQKRKVIQGIGRIAAMWSIWK